MVDYEREVTTWPRSLRANLAFSDTLFGHGLVPDPPTFYQGGHDGYHGRPVVFSFLETALDKNGDTDSRIYVCVAAGANKDQILCLVTQMPLFAFHFDVLRRLAASKGSSSYERLAEQLANFDARSVVKPMEELDVSMALGFGARMSLQLPSKTSSNMTWDEFSWISSWAIECLLEDCPANLGEELLTLVALALQEHRLLILGETRYANKIALLLHALLYPFRWQHLLLTAAVPPQAMEFDLEECPIPMIVTRQVLSVHYPTLDSLPPMIIAAEVDSRGITLGGQPFAKRNRCCLCLPSPRALPKRRGRGRSEQCRAIHRFPRHRELCKELATTVKDYAKRRLQKNVARDKISQVLRRGVMDSAEIVKQYAVYVAETSRHSSDLDLLVAEMYRPDRFMKWLPTTQFREFHASVFDTQAFVDLFYREVEAHRERMERMSLSVGVSLREAIFRQESI